MAATIDSRLFAFALAFAGCHEPGTFASALRTLAVPAGLAERTSTPELSGIAFAPSLDRYLVVSDDTGRKDRGNAHAPWLFTLSRAGELDPEPLLIDGLDRLNDAESISAGPEGMFFVCTSHSPNKHGDTPPERALLLALELKDRSLGVIGRADLRGAEDSRALLAAVGLDPAGRLDVEGVAFHGDALYFGLKSPLAADGSALVLRLEHPLAALQAGHVRTEDVKRYAAVQLSGPGENGPVNQGISELIFLPDGRLLVLANAAKGLPRDLGGALFQIKNPSPGVLSPTLVRRFPGLKPEGIALAPDGRTIVIVFDRDRDPPAWIELPLPE